MTGPAQARTSAAARGAMFRMGWRRRGDVASVGLSRRDLTNEKGPETPHRDRGDASGPSLRSSELPRPSGGRGGRRGGGTVGRSRRLLLQLGEEFGRRRGFGLGLRQVNLAVGVGLAVDGQEQGIEL